MMASLQAALKSAIQVEYQLEDSELAAATVAKWRCAPIYSFLRNLPKAVRVCVTPASG